MPPTETTDRSAFLRLRSVVFRLQSQLVQRRLPVPPTPDSVSQPLLSAVKIKKCKLSYCSGTCKTKLVSSNERRGLVFVCVWLLFKSFQCHTAAFSVSLLSRLVRLLQFPPPTHPHPELFSLPPPPSLPSHSPPSLPKLLFHCCACEDDLTASLLPKALASLKTIPVLASNLLHPLKSVSQLAGCSVPFSSVLASTLPSGPRFHSVINGAVKFQKPERSLWSRFSFSLCFWQEDCSLFETKQLRATEPEPEAIALSLLGPVPQAARRLQFTGGFRFTCLNEAAVC